jgi:signal transduction histidine kinase
MPAWRRRQNEHRKSEVGVANSLNRARSFFLSHRFHLIGGALIAATVIGANLMVWERHQETISSYERELENLSVTLAEQTAQSMQAVDLVLQELHTKAAAGTEDPAAFERDMASESAHQFLANRLSALPQAQGIGVVDAKGVLIASSRDWPARRFDFSDMDFFRHFRDTDYHGVFVSAPVRSRVTKAWTFSLARRVDGPHGGFLGLAIAAVDLGYFAELYKAISLPPGGSVTVFRDDGTMLVRYPQAEAMIGRKLPADSKWYPVVAKGGGTFTATTAFIDDVIRIVSIRTIRNYPLVVAVTVPESAALARWRHFALIVAGSAGFISICFALLFDALARGSRKLERSNREVHEARGILSDAIESISEAIIIWDHEDRLVLCNERSRVLYGENADLLVPGQKFEDILRAAAHRGVYANVTGHVEEWLAERVAAHRQPSGTLEQRLADGRIVLVAEQRMKDGGIAGLRIDITKLKQIEAQLRDAMEHLTRVQRIAGVGGLEVDITQQPVKVIWSTEACVLFGIDLASVESTLEFVLRFVHPDDYATVREAAEVANSTGTPAPPLEYRIIRPDGSERTLYRENAIQFNDAGKAVRRVITYQDITEFKRTEHQLREAKDAAETANLAKSQFLANMSHELRTPLNAIIGFSELLEAGIAGSLQPKQKTNVEIIRQSGGHLLNVINDILDLAKVDAGKFQLYDEEDVDPRGVIEACFELVKARATESGLTLTMDAEGHLPALVVDPTRLKQILLNLLSNAIKFTPSGGSVAIAVHRTKGGGVAFEVRDTGQGMTSDEVKIALEPFGQADGGLARRREGTGLGVPLAKRFTELHDGSLKIKSAKGRGTTVTVTLPAKRVMDPPMSSVSPVVAA